MTKQELRTEMIRKLRSQERPDAAVVVERICSLPEYRQADFVLGYVALGSEVDVGLVMDRAVSDGKTIAFPDLEPGLVRIGDGSWRENLIILPNRTHTVETADILNINQFRDRIAHSEKSKGIILVPGLAFTEFGTRIGRGAGYYDQLLELMAHSAFADVVPIGICRQVQLVEDLPQQPHDRKVRMVIAF